jgi:hypothetical protein
LSLTLGVESRMSSYGSVRLRTFAKMVEISGEGRVSCLLVRRVTYTCNICE